MEIWEILFWAALSVVLIIAEIVTVELVAVWFAGGGIAAFIVSLFETPFLGAASCLCCGIASAPSCNAAGGAAACLGSKKGGDQC